jgi:hypothetical protein
MGAHDRLALRALMGAKARGACRRAALRDAARAGLGMQAFRVFPRVP